MGMCISLLSKNNPIWMQKRSICVSSLGDKVQAKCYDDDLTCGSEMSHPLQFAPPNSRMEDDLHAFSELPAIYSLENHIFCGYL